MECASRKEVIDMIERLAHVTQKLAGLFLGGVGVVVQISNFLICLALILFGFEAVITHLPQA
jgi:hypothetical protein